MVDGPDVARVAGEGDQVVAPAVVVVVDHGVGEAFDDGFGCGCDVG